MISEKVTILYRMWLKCTFNANLFCLRLLVLLAFSQFSVAGLCGDAVEFMGGLEWQNFASIQSVDRHHVFNKDNRTVAIPDNRFDSRLLPRFQLRSNKFKLVGRPIIGHSWSETRYESSSQSVRKFSTNTTFNEAYIQWIASESALVAFGIQNFQWGPTESISPTNKIFAESVLERGSFYDPLNKYLSRLNLSAGKHFNVVFMSEIEKTKDWQEQRAEEQFEAKGLVKAELNWDGGANYFGLVGGAYESGNPWFGEYFNQDIGFLGGASVFFDVSHERHSRVWYPVIKQIPEGSQNSVIEFEQSQLASDSLKTTAVVGLKYAFEDGSNFQLEYIENELGYSKEQRDNALVSLDKTKPLQAPFVPLNTYRFAKSGLLLPGKKYVYSSLRVPDLFTVKDFTVFARYLLSLQDQSRHCLAAIEYGLSNTGTIVLSQTFNSGASNAELAGLAPLVTTLGYKHLW